MFDPFMMGGFGGFGGPGGFGGQDEDWDALDPYGMDVEPDEHEEKLMRVANCLGLFPCDDFEITLENACYMCNVDPAEFDEEDRAQLEEMIE